MRIGAVIEARMASTRLPGKVLAELMPGWPMIAVIAGRAKAARRVDLVMVATTTNPADDSIAAYCHANKIPVFRGSEADVMGRSLGAAEAEGLDIMVRLTGDNPFIDPGLLDDLLEFREANGHDYVATTMMGHSANWHAEREFPRGISVEAVRLDVLRAAAAETTDPRLREFTTFVIYDQAGRWKLGAFPATGRYAFWKQPELRFTVDTPEDMRLAKLVLERLNQGVDFDTGDAIAMVAADPGLAAINSQVAHNVVSAALNTRR